MTDSVIRNALAVYYKRGNELNKAERILRTQQKPEKSTKMQTEDVQRQKEPDVPQKEHKNRPAPQPANESALVTSCPASTVPSIVVDPKHIEKFKTPYRNLRCKAEQSCAVQIRNPQGNNFQKIEGTNGAPKKREKTGEIVRARRNLTTFDSTRERLVVTSTPTTSPASLSHEVTELIEKPSVLSNVDPELIQRAQTEVGDRVAEAIHVAIDKVLGIQSPKQESYEGRITELAHDQKRAKKNWAKLKDNKKDKERPELDVEKVANAVVEKLKLMEKEKPKAPEPKIEIKTIVKKEEATQTSPKPAIKKIPKGKKRLTDSAIATIQVKTPSCCKKSCGQVIYPGRIEVREVFVEPRYEEYQQKEVEKQLENLKKESTKFLDDRVSLSDLRSVCSDSDTAISRSPETLENESSATSPTSPCKAWVKTSAVAKSTPKAKPPARLADRRSNHKMPRIKPKYEMFGSLKDHKKAKTGKAKRSVSSIRSRTPTDESSIVEAKNNVDFTIIPSAKVTRASAGAVFEVSLDVFDQKNELRHHHVVGELPNFEPRTLSVNGKPFKRVKSGRK
ncbi:unnamed protein product [Bursaphelenchus xylophilus]|uniref:(pine wood nematode) hypothetical protein n=1 Tax=Bursaphelenchus xylophilus TaxID=6326 RepID=A0A1I7SB50_BURXY|nr:unnamed protein product [Bursaphelenchus xylophilus]CAG9131747.1 unnamed protein product [Bursaphelenchus xylophilus]